MKPFTKLFASILTSSIWRTDDKTRIVWITMLAMADRDGEVGASVGGLADMARISVPACKKALSNLLSPDEDSRNKSAESPRIEKIDGGWRLLNYSKYRQLGREMDRREYFRLKKREERAKISAENSNVNNVNNCPKLSTKSPIAEAEAEAEAEAKNTSPSATVIPPSLNTERFRKAWEEWNQFRTQKRQRLTPLTISKQMAKLDEWGEPKAIQSINNSIAAGWTGLFEPKNGRDENTYIATPPRPFVEDR
jgi:hypothetical protein